jgi:16S rRNA (uracil1498-N3)-methyltransferase
MHRFIISGIAGDRAILTDAAQLHHIRDVLRLKVDDEVVVSDGAGHDFKGVIAEINKKQVELRLTPLKTRRGKRARLTIACAVPKGGRLDDIIDYLTQLGVTRIIPTRTDRVVVALDEAKAAARLQRWQKIARSAAQQCQRSDIPDVSPVTDFKDVIAKSGDFDLKLIPHLSGERKLIKDVLAKRSIKNIIVLIGPEGDFTPEEVELALHNGFIPVSLGDTVLRVGILSLRSTVNPVLSVRKQPPAKMGVFLHKTTSWYDCAAASHQSYF